MDYRLLAIGLLFAVVAVSGCIDGGEEEIPGDDLDEEPGDEPQPEPEPEPEDEELEPEDTVPEDEPIE